MAALGRSAPLSRNHRSTGDRGTDDCSGDRCDYHRSARCDHCGAGENLKVLFILNY